MQGGLPRAGLTMLSLAAALVSASTAKAQPSFVWSKPTLIAGASKHPSDSQIAVDRIGATIISYQSLRPGSNDQFLGRTDPGHGAKPVVRVLNGPPPEDDSAYPYPQQSNDRGDVLTSTVFDEHVSVEWVALRRPGRPFAAPQGLRNGYPSVIDLGPDRDALFVASGRGGLRVRTAGPRATSFTRSRALPHAAASDALWAKVGSGGRALIAWTGRHHGSGVWVARRARRNARWRTKRLASRRVHASRITGFMRADGHAVIAWQTRSHKRYRQVAATGSTGRGFSLPVAVSSAAPSMGSKTGAAVDGRGASIIAVAAGKQGARRIAVAQARPGHRSRVPARARQAWPGWGSTAPSGLGRTPPQLSSNQQCRPPRRPAPSA